MKPFVYTVVGGHPDSFRCARLLRQSIDQWNTGRYDWAEYVAPDWLRPYAGVYKLMVDLPPDRDCYLYLDADVLYLESLDVACAAVASGKCDVAVCHEAYPMSHRWFRYPDASPADYAIMQRRRAINGGSFAFADPTFLRVAYSFFRSARRRPQVRGEVAKSAALEQSAINYAWLRTNYRTWTFPVEFQPDRSVQSRGIFHFVGDAGNMSRKLARMTRFMEKRNGEGEKESGASAK